MGKHIERIFKKISLKPNAASHNNTSWYTDKYGFLEHSPSGGNLYYKGFTIQKLIPEFCVPPHTTWGPGSYLVSLPHHTVPSQGPLHVLSPQAQGATVVTKTSRIQEMIVK